MIFEAQKKHHIFISQPLTISTSTTTTITNAFFSAHSLCLYSECKHIPAENIFWIENKWQHLERKSEQYWTGACSQTHSWYVDLWMIEWKQRLGWIHSEQVRTIEIEREKERWMGEKRSWWGQNGLFRICFLRLFQENCCYICIKMPFRIAIIKWMLTCSEWVVRRNTSNAHYLDDAQSYSILSRIQFLPLFTFSRF